MDSGMTAFIGMVLYFEFLPLFLGGMYLWLIRILNIRSTSRQLGVMLVFIGGLHLMSVFFTVPDKYENELVSQQIYLLDNQAVNFKYRDQIRKVCADSTVKAYEFRAMMKATREAMNDKVKEVGSYTIEPKNIYSADFCLFSERNTDKLFKTGGTNVE